MKDNKLKHEVYRVIHDNWPIHPSGVCRKLNIDTSITNISKIKYYFDSLEQSGDIHTRKIDRALVAWPAEIDRIRIVHDLMKGVG